MLRRSVTSYTDDHVPLGALPRHIWFDRAAEEDGDIMSLVLDLPEYWLSRDRRVVRTRDEMSFITYVPDPHATDTELAMASAGLLMMHEIAEYDGCYMDCHPEGGEHFREQLNDLIELMRKWAEKWPLD